MDLIKREVGYEDLGRNQNLVVTATTLYFPIYLTQKFEDLGIYTDATNPLPKTTNIFPGELDLTYDGTQQRECVTTNKCQVVSTITNCTTYGGNEGSIQVTLVPTADCPGPVTFNWFGPQGFTSQNQTVNGLFAGDYSLKITDVNCDKTYVIFNVQQPPPLSSELLINNSQVNASTGICNGIATAIAYNGVPPYTYAWYSAGTTTPILGTNSTLNNLCIGTYYVIVTDASGTFVSTTFDITQPEILSGRTIDVVNINCNGEAGSIEVEGLGGVVGTGYTYQLLQGSPATVIQQNVTGFFENITQTNSAYIVRIIDSIGQTFDLYVSVTQPVSPISITVSVNNSYNDGINADTPILATGVISFSVTGGLGIQQGGSVVYNINLEPTMLPNGTTGIYEGTIGPGGFTTANSTALYSLESGWYKITATDNFCEKSQNVLVSHQFQSSVGVYNLGGGVLRADVSNPTGYKWLTVQWSDGQSSGCPSLLLPSPTACPTVYQPSNSHPSGTELELEIIWADDSDYTDNTLWRSYKRRYRVP